MYPHLSVSVRSLYPSSVCSMVLSSETAHRSVHALVPLVETRLRPRLYHVPSCREKHWMGSPDTKHNRVYGRQPGSCNTTGSFPFHSVPPWRGVSLTHGPPPCVHIAAYTHATPGIRGSTLAGKQERERERREKSRFLCRNLLFWNKCRLIKSIMKNQKLFVDLTWTLDLELKESKLERDWMRKL